jgi:hypothetical protein
VEYTLAQRSIYKRPGLDDLEKSEQQARETSSVLLINSFKKNDNPH